MIDNLPSGALIGLDIVVGATHMGMGQATPLGGPKGVPGQGFAENPLRNQERRRVDA